MSKSFVFVAVLLMALPHAAATNVLSVARAALRDGLWEIARSQASRSPASEARLIELESYAHEERWGEILRLLAAWGEPADEGCRAYRALAAYRTGDAAAAIAALDAAPFTEEQFVQAAARLRAEMALAAGDAAAAAGFLAGCADLESQMLMAEACALRGAHTDAARIWRTAAAATNAPEKMRFAAAARLSDPAVLRDVYGQLQLPALKYRAGLCLGAALIKEDATFDEGEKLIRALVRQSPDMEGARAAFLALAQALLDRKELAAAARAFASAEEMWPDVARLASCHAGLGWAEAGLGRHDAALRAFARAAELAVEPEDKATALIKTGDMLAALGREGEAMDRYRQVRAEFPQTSAGKKIAGILRLREEEARARSLYADYRFADAQKIFESLAQADPARRSRMEFCCVLCLYGQGRDGEAERLARALAEGNAEASVRAEASRWLAKLAYNQGRWKTSADLFMASAESMREDVAAASECLVWAARAAFAGNDFPRAISTVALLVSRYPAAPHLPAGLIVQGEALIELARFDEALLVFERAGLAAGATPDERLCARLLRADALFAMGADHPARYQAALEAYQAVLIGENPTPAHKITLAFKIARTLEKLARTDEAMEQYYSRVVLAYRAGCEKGELYDDEAKAVFSRAAFRLAEEYESRGRVFQAIRVLELVVASRVPAADEASRRIERLGRKGEGL